MQDVNGKKIHGYRYGPYFFGVNRAGGHGEHIHGLCGVSYESENELVGEYDHTLGDYRENPKLIRVYEDDTEVQLRPKTESAA